MIRVVLPAPLRELARCPRELQLDVAGDVTLCAVFDAIEAQYPVLRGTMRDAQTGARRAFVRYFACEQDLSHEPADAVLPPAVIAGTEPLLVVGAMSGG